MLAFVRSLIAKKLARRSEVPSIQNGLRRLHSRGFVPRMIFDVGAYHGEFALACESLWPSALLALFEPQPGCFEKLVALAGARSTMRVFPVLLGSQEQPGVPLNVAETASSVLVEHLARHRQVECDQTTLSAVVNSEYGGVVPELVKIDVQGYELEVLNGACDVLGGIEVMIIEMNILDLHVSVPLVADILDWLNQRNLCVYDICGLTRRPLDGALWQADIIVVNRDHWLRRDKRWA